MAREGAPERGRDGFWDAFECAAFIINHLGEEAGGRAAKKAGALDSEHELARLRKEQADKVALENQVSRGELMPEAEVVSTWQSIITAARAKFLALPTKMAPILAPVTDPIDVQDQLTAAVHDCLSELVDEPKYGSDEEPDGEVGGEEESDEAMAPAAALDRQPVGRQKPEAQPGI